MSVTIKDISRKTGLGIGTISKYLNGGSLRPKNREAIEAAIHELNYTANDLARGLKTNCSRTIGVIINDISNVFFTSIITSMDDYLRKNGYAAIICDCRCSEALERDAVRFLLGKRVDGIVNMPFTVDGAHLLPAIEKKIPIVLIDRPILEFEGKTDVVLVNNIGAAYEAAHHLLNHGHKKIGIIVGPSDSYTSAERLRGHQMALAEHGIPSESRLIARSDYSIQGGYDSMMKLLEQDITAVFVTNFELTIGAMIALNEADVRVPQDLSFIGFDNLPYAQVIRPKLTIVAQPYIDIGHHVACLMFGHLGKSPVANSQTITLPTTLIIGNSVRAL